MLIALEFNNGDIKLIPLSIPCLLFSFLVPGCDYVALVGNGFCNDENNNPDCNYDGGDCCATNVNTNTCSECACLLIETCAGGYHPLVGNGFCNSDTNIAECDYDGLDCCSIMVGDGICNDETNNLECNYDGGDCCGPALSCKYLLNQSNDTILYNANIILKKRNSYCSLTTLLPFLNFINSVVTIKVNSNFLLDS